jgi:hypothetical protein
LSLIAGYSRIFDQSSHLNSNSTPPSSSSNLLLPLKYYLHLALMLSRSRYQRHVEPINGLLESLVDIEFSITQFSAQNRSIADELSAELSQNESSPNCEDGAVKEGSGKDMQQRILLSTIAGNKRLLADLEGQLCKKINLVITLSSGPLSSDMFKELEEQVFSLQTTLQTPNMSAEGIGGICEASLMASADSVQHAPLSPVGSSQAKANNKKRTRTMHELLHNSLSSTTSPDDSREDEVSNVSAGTSVPVGEAVSTDAGAALTPNAKCASSDVATLPEQDRRRQGLSEAEVPKVVVAAYQRDDLSGEHVAIDVFTSPVSDLSCCHSQSSQEIDISGINSFALTGLTNTSCEDAGPEPMPADAEPEIVDLNAAKDFAGNENEDCVAAVLMDPVGDDEGARDGRGLTESASKESGEVLEMSGRCKRARENGGSDISQPHEKNGDVLKSSMVVVDFAAGTVSQSQNKRRPASSPVGIYRSKSVP